ncbi:MAG TPA: hypothetical protein VNE41_11980 [Chitinophagaceae bacterium]|nr:hypothetical protein [Chitinophagaceae bacterium]
MMRKYHVRIWEGLRGRFPGSTRLATWQPDDPELYDRMGKQRAEEGYLTPPFAVKNP